MALKRSEVSGYKIMYYGQQEGRVMGAVIHCYLEKKVVATLEFYHEQRGKDIPASRIRGTRPYLSFPMARYGDLVDILRNEAPLFVTFNDKSLMGYIATETEDIGEGEP